MPSGVTITGLERNSSRPAASRSRYQASIGAAAHPSATAAAVASEIAAITLLPSMAMSVLSMAPLHEV